MSEDPVVLESRLKEAEKEINQLQCRVRDAEHGKGNLAAQVESLMDECEKLKADRDKHKEDAETFFLKNGELITTTDVRIAELNRLKGELQKKTDECAELEKEKNAYRSEAKVLKDSRDKGCEWQEALKKKYEESRAECENLRKHLDRANEDIENMRRVRPDTPENVSRLEEVCSELVMDCEGYKDQVRLAEVRLSKIKDERDALSKTNSELVAQLVEESGKYAEGYAQVRTWNNELEEAGHMNRTRIAELEEKRTKDKAKIKKLKKKIRKLKK